jgi:hypothetical protein
MIRFAIFMANLIVIGAMYVEAYWKRVALVIVLGWFVLLGIYVSFLWALGAIGIGNFYMYYGPANLVTCFHGVLR